MSDDDDADPKLLALLAKSLGLTSNDGDPAPPSTHILQDAEYVYDNSTDVALSMSGTKAAASLIWQQMQEKQYSTETWSQHELHPKSKDASTVDFIFLMDLLNFCFWPDREDDPRQKFAVDFAGKLRTGYTSLVACIQRALNDGIPITSPSFWINVENCTDDVLRNVFRSSTDATVPLLDERIQCIREAGYVLHERFEGTFHTCIKEANGSAARLVNLVVENFPCFNDSHVYEGRTVRYHKRAQILVADLWACFNGESFGYFADIEHLTMFADYRVPQILHALSCISYSPLLESHIRQRKVIESGHPWELQIRGCSIWSVELIRREIKRHHPEAVVNAVLIDFFLYDTMKELQAQGKESIPHHRVRSIWY